MAKKHFKKAVQEKMRSNFEDDSDPSLISKKFWSHVKSTSNSTRIPETIHYKGKFRNNIADQCELFNLYFENQLYFEILHHPKFTFGDRNFATNENQTVIQSFKIQTSVFLSDFKL